MSADSAPALRKEARNARRLLWLIPTLVLVSCFLVRAVVTSQVVSTQLAVKLAGQLANRTRSSVQLSGMRFAWNFAPCFQDFRLYRYHGPFRVEVTTKEACVERWFSALGSGFHAVRIKLAKPAISVQGSAEGSNPDSMDSSPKKNSANGKSQRANLREIELIFDDLRLDWEGLALPPRFAQGSFGPIDGQIRVQKRGARSSASVELNEPKSGTQLTGQVTPTLEGWDLAGGIEGDLVAVFGELLSSSRFSLKAMPSKGRIGANYRSKGQKLTVDLDLFQYDVDLSSSVVAKSRLVGFSARETARIEVDLAERTLRMPRGLVEVNGIPVEIALDLASGDPSPTFSVTADIRTAPFVRLLGSIPGTELPKLIDSISPEILFAFSFSMKGALMTPATWEPKLDYQFQGLAAENHGLNYLLGSFEYFPLTKEGRAEKGLRIGPQEPDWVGYRSIPYLLRRAVIVSEDSSFPFHEGIEMEEMRAAIQRTIETGVRPRGGSTLTQQLVKNLFLRRDRTASRKVQELLLAFYIERVFSKEQIFTLYMNIIEWGPEIYGIRPAAQHYFGKRLGQLSPREAIYLATIIPGPLLFHKHYEQGYVSGKHRAKVNSLLRRLKRLGQLAEAAADEAENGKIRFSRR